MSRFAIHNTDCLSFLRGSGNRFDCIVTSPPYNNSTQYENYRDTWPRHAYLELADQWATEFAENLRDTGSLFLIVGGNDPGLTHELACVFQRRWVLQNRIVWLKAVSLDTAGEPLSRGQFRPKGGDRFLNDLHELVLHFTLSGRVALQRKAPGLAVPHQDAANAKRWAGNADGLRCRGNVWFVPYATRQTAGSHPCPFPPRVAELCLLLAGAGPGAQVLDPFCGEGNAGVAALRLGCDFTGIDLGPGYCATARARLAELAGEELAS